MKIIYKLKFILLRFFKKYKLILSIILSAVIIFLLFKNYDTKSIFFKISNIDFTYFLYFIFLFIPQLLIVSFRWKFIMKKINNYPIGFFRSFQMCVASYSANLIIPGKMGEVIRLIWINKKKSKYPNLFIILFEKFFDLLSVFSIYYFSLFFLQSRINLYYDIFIYTNIFVFLCVLFLIVLKFFKINFLEKNLIFIKLFFQENLRNVLWVFFQSVFLWFVQILQFYFLFKSFLIDIGFLYVIAGSSLSVLAGALILSIGGVGPRDATLLYFFKSFVIETTLLSIGVLSSLRIIIPAIIGLPFLINLSKSNEKKRNLG